MSTAAVNRAVARAERVLPGSPALPGKRDPRWQAIIRIGAFVETHPEEVWQFVQRWGKHAQLDIRAAVATCLLEHLLQAHFERIFPRVRSAAFESARFARTFQMCWQFGQAEEPANHARIKRLQSQLRRTPKPPPRRAS